MTGTIPEKLHLPNVLLSCIMFFTYAGVLELVDEVDSKSTTPFHAAVPENLVSQGLLTI